MTRPPALAIKRRAHDTRVNLSSNELRHPWTEELLAAVASRMTSASMRCYPAVSEVIERLGQHLACPSDEFVLTPGSDAALRAICAYFARRGRGPVILQDPNYVAWEQTATLFGLPVRRVSRTTHDAAQDDQARRLIAEATTTSGGLIAVSVPNGPVGGCLTDAELDELAMVACQRDHLLVIDSCYQVFHGPLVAQLRRRGGSVLVVQSLSKSHGLAGLRIAVLAGAPEVLAALPAEPLEHAVSSIALIAAEVAIDHHAALRNVWQEIRHGRERAARTLRGWGLSPAATGGNFLTVRVGSRPRAATLAEAVSAAGFRVRDLSTLPGHDECIRFTIPDSPTLDAFLAALGAALSESPTECVR